MRIKIYRSPFHSPLEVAGDIVVKLHYPYSPTSTAVQINPNIQGYQESLAGPSASLRQVMTTTPTDETKTLMFDLAGTRKHSVQFRGSTYAIELVGITDEIVRDAPAKCFEFAVDVS